MVLALRDAIFLMNISINYNKYVYYIPQHVSAMNHH